MEDPYYNRPEVSNSDLSALKNLLYGNDCTIPFEAYKFGSLIDAMLTSPKDVNFFNYTCNGEQYTLEQFETAKRMKHSAIKDPLFKQIIDKSEFQKIMTEQINIDYDGFKFSLKCRCKFDLWMPSVNWGGDIKSTTATSQKQFEDAARFFDYDRQRAFYMDIAGSDQDILIAISKENYKVFKIPIRRGADFFNEGQRKYKELAFQYWNLIA